MKAKRSGNAGSAHDHLPGYDRQGIGNEVGTKCRTCGTYVTFDTDRDGHLIALNWDGSRHGCAES